NALDGGPWLPGGFRSTVAEFVRELVYPPPEPYTPAAAWLSEHAPGGASVWVLPDYAAYPLMFHAPEMLYAWQLHPGAADYAQLPRIHFRGVEPPDYLVAFGPLRRAIQWRNPPGSRYALAAVLNTYWNAQYRPELVLHRFKAVPAFDPASEAVYIF